MSTLIEFRELPSQFDEVLALAASGNEMLLTDGGTPRARLVPLASSRPRVAGLHPGAIQASADFDAPLPDDFWTGRS